MCGKITYIENGTEKPISKTTKNEDGTEKPVSKTTKNEYHLEKIKKAVEKLLTTKNVHFMLGAGTSSPAIPTMEELQKCFEANIIDAKKEKELYEHIIKKECKNGKQLNLEQILGKLYNANHIKELLDNKHKGAIEGLRNSIKTFLLKKINKIDDDTVNRYQKFYRRVTFRNKDLARVNIFTTNYDLLNEKAMDNLHINYNNGFGGGLKRYFNSARFHYTLSQKLDPSIEKFEPIESMVYLYKLHGSISWIKSGNGKLDIFPDIEEKLPPENPENKNDHVLIYPSPLKEGDTLSSPYSDLMREFKSKLLLSHSVLFVIGYSFSDVHINNIIYQAMAVNSSLSIFIFGERRGDLPDNDHRLYQLFETEEAGEENSPIHYFERIVNEILPMPKKEDHAGKKLLNDFIVHLNKSKSDEQQ